MKTYRHSIRTIMVLLAFAGTVTIISCSDDFIDRGSLDQPAPENFFVNEISARNANSAIYNFWLRDARLHNRDLWIIFDAMTDDANWRTNRAESIQQEKLDIYPTHVPMVNYWTQVYRSINAANFAIEGIPTSSDETFAEEDRIFADDINKIKSIISDFSFVQRLNEYASGKEIFLNTGYEEFGAI